jgi:Flp pilus assembly protein TadD
MLTLSIANPHQPHFPPMDSRSPRPPGSSSTGPRPEGEAAPSDTEARQRDARRRRLSLLLSLTLVVVMVGWLIRSQAPLTILANWYASQAQTKLYEEDDLDGALAACDKAVSWQPDDASFRALRAQIREERAEWPEALEDLNKVLEFNPNYPDGLLQRSLVQMQLENYDAAVADARKASDWWGNEDPRGLNHLAYTLAVANRELDKALEDAERAIKLTHASRDRAAAKSGSSPAAGPDGKSADDSADAAQDAEDGDEALSSYLDTRGFIHFRLGQAQAKAPEQAKTHYQTAVADFDEAIKLMERSKKTTLEKLKAKASPRQAYAERHLNATLGVLHQHRYQAYEALGQKEKAAADKEIAARRGYDPAKHGL